MLTAHLVLLTSGPTKSHSLVVLLFLEDSNSVVVTITTTSLLLTHFRHIQIGNTVYVPYLVGLTVNITSFTVGATAPGTPSPCPTLSTLVTPCLLLAMRLLAAGANSSPFGVKMVSSRMTLSMSAIELLLPPPTVVPGYNRSNQHACQAFATDNKFYGELCYGRDFAGGNFLY